MRIRSYVKDKASSELGITDQPIGRVVESGWTVPAGRPIRIYLIESNSYVWRSEEELEPIHCECPLNGEPCHTCGTVECKAPASEATAHADAQAAAAHQK